jgi:DNA polymerase III epsilon subunit-like protein
MADKLYIFFDTETTGVPRNYKAPTTDTDNWPRLVQLGWILMDSEGNKMAQHDYIVRPVGFKIPAEAASVHGITTEKALEEGRDLAEVIDEFMADFDKATFIVGHNISFDQNIVGAELVRLNRPDVMTSKRTFCTMQAGTNFCKIPGKYGYKWPKLMELYVKLFGHDFEGAHNAMSDIDATQECFWEMRKRGLI